MWIVDGFLIVRLVCGGCRRLRSIAEICRLSIRHMVFTTTSCWLSGPEPHTRNCVSSVSMASTSSTPTSATRLATQSLKDLSTGFSQSCRMKEHKEFYDSGVTLRVFVQFCCVVLYDYIAINVQDAAKKWPNTKNGVFSDHVIVNS